MERKNWAEMGGGKGAEALIGQGLRNSEGPKHFEKTRLRLIAVLSDAVDTGDAARISFSDGDSILDLTFGAMGNPIMVTIFAVAN
ncbi:hypothetical protein DM860_013575 [Cuscuta australis]|uniref:Uncharacterized protein n=1 Tax=Cuscuta australis TaxID=267555 RepID=A0A328EE66_9ASTE|nr:hypothetical protein DM860_013575 [Cuscuta australis]